MSLPFVPLHWRRLIAVVCKVSVFPSFHRTIAKSRFSFAIVKHQRFLSPFFPVLFRKHGVIICYSVLPGILGARRSRRCCRFVLCFPSSLFTQQHAFYLTVLFRTTSFLFHCYLQCSIPKGHMLVLLKRRRFSRHFSGPSQWLVMFICVSLLGLIVTSFFLCTSLSLQAKDLFWYSTVASFVIQGKQFYSCFFTFSSFSR